VVFVAPLRVAGRYRFRYSAAMKNTGTARFQELSAALATDQNLAAAYVFGSYARGTPTALSDIDIAVLFRRSVDESRYFDLRLDYLTRIMELLRAERVDLVILNNAPLHIAYEAVSKGILIADGDRGYRVAFEVDRIGRFLDFKPFLAVQLRAMKKHLAEGTFFD
jgi:predicted nucleotidyltransferase